MGAALITGNGKIFVGLCFDLSCGLGCCAEYAAISSMITSGETKIKQIVAVDSDGKILPPCGKCRELIYQINNKNLKTEVVVRKDKSVKLNNLLNYRWEEVYSRGKV